MKNYTNDDIRKYAIEVKSMACLLSKLGLKQAGGNCEHIKCKLQELNIDCSHWTGQLWSKGRHLKDWNEYTRATRLLKPLVKLRMHTCEICKNSTWNDKPITLEIHHIDGNNKNNHLDNLQLLCPNCHAQTDNWRRKKKITT